MEKKRIFRFHSLTCLTQRLLKTLTGTMMTQEMDSLLKQLKTFLKVDSSSIATARNAIIDSS